LGNIARFFVDEKDGSLNARFYVLAYFVLAHVFFWKFMVPGQMIFGTDVQNQSYPIQHMAVEQMLESRSLMLWNPYIFSGMPFLASFSFPFFYPFALLFFVLPLGFAMGYEMVLHFFLMGVFMYALLRRLRLSRQAAFVGGLVFMFNCHLVSLVYPGHGGKIFTVTYLPLALMLLARGFDSDRLYNFGLLGLVVGVMFYGGHPQILFYCGIAIALFFVFMAAAEFKKNRAAGTARLFGFLTMSFALGALLYAVILFPAMQYRSYTQRSGGESGGSSYEFATSFSQPPEDMLYVPLRNPFGWGKDYGPNTPTTDGIFYRGRIGLRLSVDYAGVFVLVLAIFAALFVRNRYTWYFAALALLSMFLALGGFNPLYVYVYKYVPGFSLFRVPYAIMILLSVCWGALSGFGLQRLLDMNKPAREKGLMYFTYACAAVTFAVLGLWLYWKSDADGVVNSLLGYDWVRQMLWGYYADVQQRFAFFVHNLVVFSTLMAVSAGILFAYRKGWLTKRMLVAVAAVFILVDLWPVGWEFVKTVPTSTIEQVYFRKTPAIKTMLDDKGGPFRVLSLVTNNELLYYRIQGMTGYHAVILGYYENALGRLDFGGGLIDLLNGKYLMLKKEPQNDFAAYPNATVRDALMRKYELLDDNGMYFYRNRSPQGRAWLVNRIWWTRNLDEALNIITDRRFVSKDFAVIAAPQENGASAPAVSPPIQEGADLSGQKVELSKFGPDRLEFRVFSPAAAFMVVSEVWYPGWKAFIDGKKTEIFRTDYLLRGVSMPAGEHVLTMKFDPPLFKLGAVVSSLALLFMAWLIIRERRKRRVPARGEG
jgi:Bacterial membrane protein YfhO